MRLDWNELLGAGDGAVGLSREEGACANGRVAVAREFPLRS
jgi:hypothetical protein